MYKNKVADMPIARSVIEAINVSVFYSVAEGGDYAAATAPPYALYVLDACSAEETRPNLQLALNYYFCWATPLRCKISPVTVPNLYNLVDYRGFGDIAPMSTIRLRNGNVVYLDLYDLFSYLAIDVDNARLHKSLEYILGEFLAPSYTDKNFRKLLLNLLANLLKENCQCIIAFGATSRFLC
jgi:hypothetical protein